MTFNQLRIVYEELLNASCQQVNIIEAFFCEDPCYGRPVPLVVVHHDNHLMVKVFEAAECLEMVVSIDPAMREAYWAHDVELIKLFVAVDAITSSINHEDILVREI